MDRNTNLGIVGVSSFEVLDSKERHEIKKFITLYYENKGIPRKKDLSEEWKKKIFKHFKTMKEVLRFCGVLDLEIEKQKLGILNSLREHSGRVVGFSYEKVDKYFGDIYNARRMAGITKGGLLILTLQDFYDKYGRVPTTVDCNKYKELKAYTTYLRNFGSWGDAISGIKK